MDLQVATWVNYYAKKSGLCQSIFRGTDTFRLT